MLTVSTIDAQRSASYAYPVDLTLEAARRLVMASVERGSRCPCCDQMARAYKRRLYPTQAVALQRLHDHLTAPGAPTAVHLGEFLASFPGTASRGGDTARLAYWDLIKRHKGGFYSITELGIAWVRGEVRIPAYKWFYNEAVCDGKPAPLVSFKEILDVRPTRTKKTARNHTP